MSDARVNELEVELAALRRQNDQLGQLADQAIRMGEGLLVQAREAVNAYREYIRSASVRSKVAKPGARQLADAMENLSRLVGEATPEGTRS